ncbi:MAG: prolyl oligopeptidase family serine peptidase [Holophagaceae bacterium]|nr:prolyl oligopeptidase family serine peptidase [Holophagaceae bacterium]
MCFADLARLALAFLGAGALEAQGSEAGFLERDLTHGGHRYRYQLYLPAEYPTRTDWPVILYLHGAGERGADGLRPTQAGLGAAIRRAPKRFPAIVVFPQVPPGTQWTGAQADMALAALDRVLGEYRVNADRVYLTGLSMGGHGTWYLAYRHPERFAAAAPICGWTRDLASHGFMEPVVPPEAGPALPALARRLARLPLWIFHGDQDTVVPVEGSRAAVEALKAVSADVRYTEYPGLNHNSWDATYASDAFVTWLFAQRRARR